MYRRRGPFDSAWFGVLEATFVGLSLLMLMAGVALSDASHLDRTECVVGHFTEFDPQETGRVTVVCPAVEGPAASESITVYVDRDHPGEAYTDSIVVYVLIVGVLSVIGAIVLPLACWLDWRRKHVPGEVVVVAPHPPAWRSDPTGRHLYRWWTGSSWTDFVSDGGATSVDSLRPRAPLPA